MLKIIVCLAIGYFIGMILTTIFLCQKNIEQYEQVKSKVEKEIESGKKIYKSQLSETKDDFDSQADVVYGVLKSLYDNEDKTDYKNAVLGIYNVLEQFCADEEEQAEKE